MALVCIDPGHAKNTTGKRSFDEKLMEYEFNRDVAKRLQYHLNRHNIKTIYSCDIEDDKDASLILRCNKANSASADLFISIHANAYGTNWNTANGWEVFYYKGSDKGYKLAQCIHNHSIPFLGLKDRGIKDGSKFAVINGTSMPAILVEHGFYTNKNECTLLLTNEFREKCAIADAKGILDYFGIKWKDDGKSNYEINVDYLVENNVIKDRTYWDNNGSKNVTRDVLVAMMANLHKSIK